MKDKTCDIMNLDSKPTPWKLYLIIGLLLVTAFLWFQDNINQNIIAGQKESLDLLDKRIDSLQEKIDMRAELADEFNMVWLDGFDHGYDAAIEELDCVQRINTTIIGGVD